MEVLAPVRDLNTLLIAANSGADAVYFAGDAFSARVGAQIDRSEAIEMIQLCRRLCIKCYLTVNTLIYQDELTDFIEYVSEMYIAGVDAFIIQNIGLIPFFKKYYNESEIHASTQMHVSNLSAAYYVRELGVDRIVMPRELSFEVIKQIKDNIHLPLEVFIHGALCISYSGQCLISSLVGGRSANKGNCAQICRKSYQWHIDGIPYNEMKPLLNLKDLNASDHINQYYESGIDSLKIEGRLKSEEYIMATTQYYASLVDQDSQAPIQQDDLKVVFNRDFSAGRIASMNSSKMINSERVNHTGLEVGTVVEFQNGYCTLNITKPIHRLDQLRFVKDNFEDGLQVPKLFQDNQNVEYAAHGIVKVPFKRSVPKGAIVYQLSSAKLKQQLSLISSTLLRSTEIKIRIAVAVGKPIEIILDLDEQTHHFVGDIICQTPLKHAVSQERIIEQLQKTNHTAYCFDIKVEHYEPVFIAMSEITKLKTVLLEFIDTYYTKPRKISQIASISVQKDQVKVDSCITYQVRDMVQANCLTKVKPSKVYVSNLHEFHKIKEILELSNHHVIPVLPNVVDSMYFDEMIAIVEDEQHIMVSELGYLNYFKGKKTLHSNHTLYCTNEFDQRALKAASVDIMTLPVEATAQQIVSLDTSSSELIVYGYVNAMSLNVCPINPSKVTTCGHCTKCIDNKYELVNEHNDRFLIRRIGFDQLVVFQSKPIDLLSQLDIYRNKVSQFRVIFEFENKAEVESILNRVNQSMNIYK